MKRAEERLTAAEAQLENMGKKLTNDFHSLESLKQSEAEDQEMMQASLEEREIIMRALLAIIDGVHQLGANGPTTAAHDEITAYLSRQAHKG